MLAPERAYEIDAISLAVLNEIDGEKTVAEIVGAARRAYTARRRRRIARRDQACCRASPTNGCCATAPTLSRRRRCPRSRVDMRLSRAARRAAGGTHASLSFAMPVLLQSARTRARKCRVGAEEWGDVPQRGGDRRAATAPLRRRADRAPGSRRDPGLRRRGRALHQSS